MIAFIALCLAAASAWSQESSAPPLGDVARNTRRELAEPHRPAKQLVNEEEDGPDTTGVWRMHLCQRTPCYELTITLPKAPKWTRATDEPHPVMLVLPGGERDANRVIRIYAAQLLQPTYVMLDLATRDFVQGWFARPEYFGRAAHVVREEQVLIDNRPAMFSQFTLAPEAERLRGMAVVANSPNGNYGFACVFRDEDSKEAASICDAILRSARNQMLITPPPTYYPPYYSPPYYPQPNDPDP